ncbi:MAG TPA: ABC transporter permease, partial [Planctomycetota bacterium]|nr:ABC transporter permease [Planctomycetota bacterium]
MSKTWIVARHEFAVTVKRVWFVVATIAFPAFMLGVGLVAMLVAEDTVRESLRAVESKPLGLVDKSGELALDPERFRILRFPDEAAARAALAEGRIVTCLAVPPNYLQTGRVQILTTRRASPLTGVRPPVPDGVEPWLLDNILRDVEPQRRKLARAPFEPVVEYLGADARPTGENVEDAQKKSIAAYAVFFLMFISIFSSSQYLLQGLAEEKEHRVMEMVLSSVTADELLRGKLLGLGAAGLLQFAVWLGMLMASTLFTPLVAVALAPVTFAICFVYFLLGYALFGSLMLGFGVLGTNARESQQMASIWSFIGISPSLVMVALFENPQGVLAKTFSYVPFTAPTTMM